ncbi:putative quinol monooxygenase [Brachybacterium hainanense]|uniref:Quinol monooxygenase n=1 Tax=Brachybacterium hainanense TaxID=1541174 RepID=A0ABV6R8L8_9MICO
MEHVDLIAAIDVTPGEVDAVRDLLAQYAEEVRSEAGNLRFEVYAADGEPSRILVVERYEDPAAFEVHLADPRNAAFNAALEDVLDGAGSRLTMLRRLV